MFSFDWHDIKTPLFISIWAVFIVVVKLLFHASEKLVLAFPDSALLIIAGFSVGTILDWIFPQHDIYLDPDLFFIYLLPPIVLEASFFLPSDIFFRNIGTIIVFAVVGTLWNIMSIAGILYLFSSFYTVETTFLNLMLFSTLISAVDPVAVLSVFTEIRVNDLLYICVFGESLLNDAVTIVLYHALNDMNLIGGDLLVLSDFIRATGAFVLVSLGGLLIGILFSIFTGLGTKAARTLPVAQPLICLLLPYLSYLISEMFHYSGILSIVACGLLMKPYIRANMSDEPRITVKYFLKTIASHSEAMIFIFLGLSTFSKNHSWDILFTVLTVISCLTCRFAGTYMLGFLCNQKRVEKIGLLDQFIIAYGGLRGAICYGLAMTLDSASVPAKDVFVSTSIVVICFTVFIQGVSIKPLVKARFTILKIQFRMLRVLSGGRDDVHFLRVETKQPSRSAVTAFIFANAQEDLLAGIEAIAGIKGRRFWRHSVMKIDREYIQPFLTNKRTLRGDKMIEEFTELSALAEKEREAEAKNKNSTLMINA